MVCLLLVTSSVIQTKISKLALPEVNEHITIHEDAIETNHDDNDEDEISTLNYAPNFLPRQFLLSFISARLGRATPRCGHNETRI